MERKRKRERGITLHLANLRRAPAWRSCMKCVFPTKDFLIRPWKPRSGGRRTRSRRREEKNFLVAEQETRVSSEGITGLFIYALMPW